MCVYWMTGSRSRFQADEYLTCRRRLLSPEKHPIIFSFFSWWEWLIGIQSRVKWPWNRGGFLCWVCALWKMILGNHVQRSFHAAVQCLRGFCFDIINVATSKEKHQKEKFQVYWQWGRVQPHTTSGMRETFTTGTPPCSLPLLFCHLFKPWGSPPPGENWALSGRIKPHDAFSLQLLFLFSFLEATGSVYNNHNKHVLK